MLLLHLSDLHFGNKNRFTDDKPEDLAGAFYRALVAAGPTSHIAGSEKIDIVIVSGDIAESGIPSEFSAAEKFLAALAEELELKRDRFVFLPGNHDISWPSCRRVRGELGDQLFLPEELESRLHSAKLANYSQFLTAFYGAPVTDASLAGLLNTTPLGQGGWLRNYPELRLSIAALNTSEKEHDESKGGFLGHEQAAALMSSWRKDEAKSYLKIIALHHNPVATTATNVSWTMEWLRSKEAAAKTPKPMSADAFKHFIDDLVGFTGKEHLVAIAKDTSAHLVLHGHHHDQGIPVVWPWTRNGGAPVLSVGSFGLNDDQLPGNAPLSCQFIKITLPPDAAEARLAAIPLVYDGRFRLEGELLSGAFRSETRSGAAYDQPLQLPEGWIDNSGIAQDTPPLDGTGSVTPSQKMSPSAFASHHQRHLQEMELQLKHALEAFKGQPTVFLEPKLSKTREFNDEPNKLHPLMEKPCDTLIIAPPEFGLTCLGLYLQVEAFKRQDFWLYVDAEQTKGRKISDLIDKELLHYDRKLIDLNCIVLDSWDADDFDHLTMAKHIASKCPGLPLIILAEDSLVPDVTGNLSKINRDFELLHLQALSRNSMRKLVAGYNETKCIGTEDVILSCVAGHLESINIHRTPLNCYTLLRVLDSSYNEKLLNKSKLLKAILFILFTDHNSFSFLSDKPEVEECAYVLGCFCKNLVRQRTRYFDSATLAPTLRDICKSRGIVLNVDVMLNVLLENNILVTNGNQTAFRHRYWIFYFAAEWMRHDDDFREFVLKDRNYVNYTEIIEFYTGIDGRRDDALEVLLSDLSHLTEQVGEKIGIERSFDPLSSLLWNPTDEYLQQARSKIAERVESSNLPAEIKDKHADGDYQSAAPYDQGISSFLKNYSVLSLLHSIKAASCALRSSPFVDLDLRHKVAKAIFQAWEEVSRVVFWLSPILAKEGRAIHDGFAVRLEEGFSDDLDKRFNEIIIANPCNIVRILGGDLASKKICSLVNECFQSTDSLLQKHMMALFVAAARPSGWQDALHNYINLLHPRSFYLGDIFSRLNQEVTLGDLEQGEELALKRLTRAIISKREYAPKLSGTKEITHNKILNEDNKLPIDQLIKGNRKNWPSI